MWETKESSKSFNIVFFTLNLFIADIYGKVLKSPCTKYWMKTLKTNNTVLINRKTDVLCDERESRSSISLRDKYVELNILFPSKVKNASVLKKN